MGDIIVAPGGGVVADGVVVYLPTCSAFSYNDISLASAKEYDITDTDYLQKLIPTVIPGFIFAVISLAGFLFFLIWLCVQCCRRRRVAPPPPAHAASEHAQFITEQGLQSADIGDPPQPTSSRPRWKRPGFLVKLVLTALALLLAGVSSWGLACSIKATNDTFTDLWDIVDAVEAQVTTATASLIELETQLTELSGNITVLSGQLSSVAVFIQGLNIQGDTVTSVMNAIQALPGELYNVLNAVSQGVVTLDDNFGDTLLSIQDTWESPTMAVEDTWRFIPIAVVFGTTIAIALLCALVYWRLAWYRTATLLTALLWFDIALLMLLGVALLRGAYVVSADSCKYVESLTLTLAGKNAADSQKQLVTKALDYYFGLINIPDDRVVYELTGVPTYLLHSIVNGTLLQVANFVISGLNTDVVQSAALNAGLSLNALSAVTNVSDLLPDVSATVLALEQQALRSNIDPLYHAAKEYICCTLSNEAHTIWVAWTAAGALGCLLAAVCTGRFAYKTLSLRKSKWQAAGLASAPFHQATPGGKGSSALEAGCYVGTQLPPAAAPAAGYDPQQHDGAVAVVATGSEGAALGTARLNQLDDDQLPPWQQQQQQTPLPPPAQQQY